MKGRIGWTWSGWLFELVNLQKAVLGMEQLLVMQFRGIISGIFALQCDPNALAELPLELATEHEVEGLVEAIRVLIGQTEVTDRSSWVAVDADQRLARVGDLAGRHQVGAITTGSDDHIGPVDQLLVVGKSIDDLRLDVSLSQTFGNVIPTLDVNIMMIQQAFIVRSSTFQLKRIKS